MQEARVKRVWAILLFFTQIGFIVFTYLIGSPLKIAVCGEASALILDFIRGWLL